jgi:antitoxin Phd
MIHVGGGNMKINTQNLMSITEANQNFSRVARMVDQNGAVIILKNNSPRYVIMEFSRFADEETATDDTVESISKRILAKNRRAFEELAK